MSRLRAIIWFARPHNHAYPVEVMAMEPGKKFHDYLIGRICYVGIET
jgi:hypothetical protein